ncbi:MAG: 3-phosphoserine/phosphohydroxythreonine transaminase [Oscillospiraceae bacterium]|jgi:phosphoserine aminotransferase|nr:3-phosphoserine/phosphohydroxythreonine transaminase [Oscillospiraceae bacterium]
MSRVYNFAAGPAAMPESVLKQAAAELVEFPGAGMSVMEMSHRGKKYIEIFENSRAAFNEAMGIPEGYTTLFLQGGATGQFAAVPLNLIDGESYVTAAYANTGNFASAAIKEARTFYSVRVVADSGKDGYTYIPEVTGVLPTDAYLHITTNNTVYGTRYDRLPESPAPLVADMSSNILSEVYDVTKFGVIYAGAQKNIGPAGLTVVIVRNDLLGRPNKHCLKILNWTEQAKADSMLNTPPTFAIYLAGLCAKWVLAQGGVSALEQVNVAKANLLYDVIDCGAFYTNPVKKEYRSRMNVIFKTPSEELDAAFVKEAEKAGLSGLKGYRTVGGMRASIYNAMPFEGANALADFMKAFEARNK